MTKSILDPTFRYTPAAATNVAKTFARVKREMKEQAEREAQYRMDAVAKVRPITGKK